MLESIKFKKKKRVFFNVCSRVSILCWKRSGLSNCQLTLPKQGKIRMLEIKARTPRKLRRGRGFNSLKCNYNRDFFPLSGGQLGHLLSQPVCLLLWEQRWCWRKTGTTSCTSSCCLTPTADYPESTRITEGGGDKLVLFKEASAGSSE